MLAEPCVVPNKRRRCAGVVSGGVRVLIATPIGTHQDRQQPRHHPLPQVVPRNPTAEKLSSLEAAELL